MRRAGVCASYCKFQLDTPGTPLPVFESSLCALHGALSALPLWGTGARSALLLLRSFCRPWPLHTAACLPLGLAERPLHLLRRLLLLLLLLHRGRHLRRRLRRRWRVRGRMRALHAAGRKGAESGGVRLYAQRRACCACKHCFNKAR